MSFCRLLELFLQTGCLSHYCSRQKVTTTTYYINSSIQRERTVGTRELGPCVSTRQRRTCCTSTWLWSEGSCTRNSCTAVLFRVLIHRPITKTTLPAYSRSHAGLLVHRHGSTTLRLFSLNYNGNVVQDLCVCVRLITSAKEHLFVC